MKDGGESRSMDREKRQAIEQDCRQVVLRSARYLDVGNFSAYANLFATDAVWARYDHCLTGREDIRAFLQARGQKHLVRHIIANLLVEASDLFTASSVAYVMNYQSEGANGAENLPAPIDLPHMICEWHDRLERTNEGWCIAERRTLVIFRDP